MQWVNALRENRDQLPYQSVFLGGLFGAVTLLLIVAANYTAPVINLVNLNEQKAAVAEVLPGIEVSADLFDSAETINVDGEAFQFLTVKDSSGNIAYQVITSQVEGYSGEIKFMVGVDSDGVIQQVRVLSHSETPGLGDKIEKIKTDWITSFHAHSLENTSIWAVQKDGGQFAQFSGATITPRAVVKGVHAVLQAQQIYLKKNVAANTQSAGDANVAQPQVNGGNTHG